MPTHNINGVDLFYDGDGDPITVHHGYTGSHDSWPPVIDQIKDRYRCIVMDGRGAGDSAHPDEGYTIEQMAADVVGIADALALDRFTYVGHSMGGVIGMELGLAHADRLDRLVLVAPAPADGIELPDSFRDRARRLWLDKERDTLIQQRLALNARIDDADEIAKSVDCALSVSQAHYDQCWDALVNYRKGDRLAEIQTPTLVMSGAADGLLSDNLLDFGRLPNATLHVFSRVSHGVPREVPRAFARVLVDFMQHGVVTARTLQKDLLAASR